MNTRQLDPLKPQEGCDAPNGPIRTAADGEPAQVPAALAGIADQVSDLLDQALNAALADTAKRRRFVAWVGEPGTLAGAKTATGNLKQCVAPAPRPGTDYKVAGAIASSPAPSAGPCQVPAWWLEMRANAQRSEPGYAAKAAPVSPFQHDSR